MNLERRKTQILLDSSFLIDCIEFKVDFVEQLKEKIGKFELLVTSSVLSELKRMAKTKPNARLVLLLLEKYKVKTIESEFKGDESLLRKALELNAFVATNDRELRKKLKSLSIKTIYLRNRKIVEIS
ncbi:MAG: 30S processome protein Utp24 [Candidatus Aenigmarchaeota archaeon]|nr:30S processome protein Utp24 [Candidatus Aenigmarchaeota archaeon]